MLSSEVFVKKPETASYKDELLSKGLSPISNAFDLISKIGGSRG